MNSRETLKFVDPLTKLVVDGTKRTTWRLNNTRDLRPGGELDLIHHSTGRLFAIAAIRSVAERTFGTLTPEDFEGHEPFTTEEDMLKTYARYYGMPVGLDTPVTVVKIDPWLTCNEPGSDETYVIVRRTA